MIFNLLKTGRRGIKVSICNVLLKRTEYYFDFFIISCSRKLEDEKMNSRIELILVLGVLLGHFWFFYGYLYQINGWIICTMKE